MGLNERVLGGRLSGRFRVLVGLACLTVAAFIAFGLLAAAAILPTPVANRPTPTAPALPAGIDWLSAAQVTGATLSFGPYLAGAGRRVYMVGSTSGTSGSIEVWSSADGTTWEQSAAPGTVEEGVPGSFPQDFCDDGQGGLIVVGGVTDDHTETNVPAAWHSSDGRTWTRAQVAGPALAQMTSVAGRPGAIVAIGDWEVKIPDNGTANGQMADQMYAWFSEDGTTWSQIILPDSLGYHPSAINSLEGRIRGRRG